MKTMFTISTLSALIAGVSGQAMAVDYTLYKTPNSQFEEAYANGSLNYADGGAQPQAAYDVKLNANYLNRQSTEFQSRQFAIDAAGSTSRDSADGADAVTSSNLGLSGSVDNYINGDPQGLFWSAGAGARFQNLATGTEQSQYDVNLGLGYGRIYDATPLARAVKLGKELSSKGVINAMPSDNVLMDIAHIVAREDEYRSKYSNVSDNTAESYRAKMLADVEAVLAQAGVLSNGLGAAGTIYANEVLFEMAVNARAHGFVVRAGAAYTGSKIGDLSNDEPALKFDAEYAKPLGETGQFTNTFSFVPAETTKRASNTMRYTTEVTDNTEWQNQWLVDYQDNDGMQTTSHTLSSDYVVRLSNRLSYSAGVQFNQASGDGIGDEGDLATRVTMGLNYRIK